MKRSTKGRSAKMASFYKKARVGKRGTRRKAAKAAQAKKQTRTPPALFGTNDFLVKKLLSAQEGGARCFLVQDLMYNLSSDLQNLAYKSGFSLGAEVFNNSDKSIDALAKVLENAGMGQVLYYPFESQSVIISRRAGPSEDRNLGANIHIFESGMISGYLSANAGRNISVKESKCVYNGDDCCEFVASAASVQDIRPATLTDMDRVLKTMGSDIELACRSVSRPYYVLSSWPLLQEPVFSEASKFLYILGRKLADSKTHNSRDMVLKMANYLGVNKATIHGRRNKEIYLSYDCVGSVGKFVDLSTSMLAGFARGAFNKNINVQRRLTGRRNYYVRMQLLPPAAAQQ